MPDNIFTAPDDTSQQVADCLPQGRAWASKNIADSNVRKLVNSIAVAHNRVQQLVQTMDEEFRIEQAYDLLTEWETSVGIPGECLGTSETMTQRRQAVIDRLRKQPLVTLADIQNYVDNLFSDITIELMPGTEYYTFEYGFELPFMGGASERFILVVKINVSGDSFEYDFEVPFIGGPDVDRLVCLLNRIVPANVYVITEYVGE